MGTFIHHPDGYILINDLYLELNEFIRYEPQYSLPAMYLGRRYIQEYGHFYYTRDTQFAGPFPWKEGDIYISKVDGYKSLYTSIVANRALEQYRQSLEATNAKALIAIEWMVNYLMRQSKVPEADIPLWIRNLMSQRAAWRKELD